MPFTLSMSKLRGSIAAKLVLYILICSSLITLALTAFQLLRDYRVELGNIDGQIKQISIGSLPTLENHLWVVNYDDLNLQLKNLHALPDIQYLLITDEQGTPVASAGKPLERYFISRLFPLQKQHRGKLIGLGTLRVDATLEGVYQRLLDKVLVILISQGTKTFLVSAFIFFIFQWLVTRHLSTIADWAKHLDVTGTDAALQLNRAEPKPTNRDELQLMVNAFNHMRENLNTAYGKLMRSHELLDQKVKARTRDLERSNHELDSFCYTVSHDLRTPLRAISSFSEILMQDYSERLDPEARNFLNRIHVAGMRMSDLIDDLLRLSRIYQSPLHLEEANLSEIAHEIVDVLRLNEPHRSVKIGIDADFHACVDPGLIRSAMENLIGNAWKYTARVEAATIAISGHYGEDELELCVRDNGAGFDMAHADMLFAPFQRLHKVDEFEGNGIGLATVQRVIQRHGGRVWGEGEVGKGARFCFTLPRIASGACARPPDQSIVDA